MVGKQSYTDFQILLILWLSNKLHPFLYPVTQSTSHARPNPKPPTNVSTNPYLPPLTHLQIRDHPAVHKTDWRKEWRLQQIKYVIKEYEGRLEEIKARYCWQKRVEPENLEGELKAYVTTAVKEKRERRERELKAREAAAQDRKAKDEIKKCQGQLGRSSGAGPLNTLSISQISVPANTKLDQSRCPASTSTLSSISKPQIPVPANTGIGQSRFPASTLTTSLNAPYPHPAVLPVSRQLPLPNILRLHATRTLNFNNPIDDFLPPLPESCVLPPLTSGLAYEKLKGNADTDKNANMHQLSLHQVLDPHSFNSTFTQLLEPRTQEKREEREKEKQQISAPVQRPQLAELSSEPVTQRVILHKDVDCAFPVGSKLAGKDVGLGLTLPKIDGKGEKIEYPW